MQQWLHKCVSMSCYTHTLPLLIKYVINRMTSLCGIMLQKRKTATESYDVLDAAFSNEAQRQSKKCKCCSS